MIFVLLMAAIVNTNLAGTTIRYNGVQFGGADAPSISAGNVTLFRSTPPMYAIRSAQRYDESNRSVTGIDCLLTVRCIVFESSESAMGQNMAALRQLLSIPGKALRLDGLGSGFGAIQIANPPNFDIGNGPKPGPLEITPLSAWAWELSWSIQFFYSPCANASTDLLAFLAFNFTTTWQNDFEGLSTRTVAGHVIIPQYRDPTAPKTVLHRADETRGQIAVDIPPGFQRVTNSWQESVDKSRLNFTIVDEQLEGECLPPGIVAGDGSFGLSFGDGSMKGAGMASGMASLSMSLKTAYNQPKNLAGQIFLTAALSKQVEMMAGMAAAKVANPALTTGVVVPVQFRIANGKFARARQTEASIAWVVTQSLNSILSAAGIWTSIGPNDYTAWKATMASLWGNRGVGGLLPSSPDEMVVIDLCDNKTSVSIGATGSNPNAPTDQVLPSLTCPDVAADGGWVYFDCQVTPKIRNAQTWHKKAALFSPGPGAYADPQQGATVSLGTSTYNQSPSDNDVVSYQGYPTTMIAMTFVGLRFKNKPAMPVIKSIGGVTAVEVESEGGEPRIYFDSFGCPIYLTRGYRVYRVPGQITTVKPVGNPISSSTPIDLSNLQL